MVSQSAEQAASPISFFPSQAPTPSTSRSGDCPVRALLHSSLYSPAKSVISRSSYGQDRGFTCSASGRKYSAMKHTFSPWGARLSASTCRFGVSKQWAGSNRRRYSSTGSRNAGDTWATTLPP